MGSHCDETACPAAKPMLVTALLKHEQKMSVVHYSIQRHPNLR